MNCSCVYVDFTSECSIPLYRKTEELIAASDICCCECKDIIKKGETYRKEHIGWGGRWNESIYITCMDCVSIRDIFFCDGWYYKMMFEYLREHIRELNGEISEDCIVALTPKAQEKVCKIIEDCWEWNEE